MWKGPYTVLLVLSDHGKPVPSVDVREFRDRLRPWTTVVLEITVVSVG